MLEEELKLDYEIARFIEQTEISDYELAAFLTNWADAAYCSDDKYLRGKCKELSNSNSFETNSAMMQRFLHGWIRDWVRANEAVILRLARALDAAKCLEGVALSKALNESWGGGRPDASRLEREIAARLKFR
jgi:hypothetical protein